MALWDRTDAPYGFSDLRLLNGRRLSVRRLFLGLECAV
jgi:hypothetical protein